MKLCRSCAALMFQSDSAYGLKWFEGKKDFVLAEVLCARLRLLSAEDASQMHLKYFFPWPNGFWKTARLKALQYLSKVNMLFGSDAVAPLQKGERNVKTRFVSETIYYESQPVGLAEVIDASEASLGAGKMDVNRVRWVGIMVFDLVRFPGSWTRWQLGDGGVQPLPGPQFWGVRGEA